MNEKIAGFLQQIFVIDIIGVLVGLLLFYGLIMSSIEIPLVYLPLIILGLVFGYFTVVFIDPGGHVNYSFNKHKKSVDEEKLYKLIAKCSSKIMILLTSFGFSLIFIYQLIIRHSPHTVISIDLVTGTFTLPGVAVLCLGTGVKYITAWWNIRRKRD